jgi:hypothetical protein
MTAQTVARAAIPALSIAEQTACAEMPVLNAAAQIDRRLAVLVEEFLAADEASRAAAEAARLQNSTVADEEAERLYGEAADAWMRVASGWAANSFVPENVLNAGREYVRPALSGVRPTAGDWRDPITVAWSRSRPAVTR